MIIIGFIIESIQTKYKTTSKAGINFGPFAINKVAIASYDIQNERLTMKATTIVFRNILLLSTFDVRKVYVGLIFSK